MSPARFAVVVVAGPAVGALSEVLDRQRALTALVEAILERGGQVVTTADAEVASLIAVVALAYAEGHAVELAAADAPLRVTETGGEDVFSRAALASFSTYAGLEYRDREGRTVQLEDLLTDSLPGEPREHPLTGVLGDSTDVPVAGAALVAPTQQQMEQARDWQRSPIAMLALNFDSQAATSSQDPVPGLLEELDFGDDEVSPDDLAFGGRSYPYGTMMELLIDRWLRLRGIATN